MVPQAKRNTSKIPASLENSKCPAASPGITVQILGTKALGNWKKKHTVSNEMNSSQVLGMMVVALSFLYYSGLSKGNLVHNGSTLHLKHLFPHIYNNVSNACPFRVLIVGIFSTGGHHTQMCN